MADAAWRKDEALRKDAVVTHAALVRPLTGHELGAWKRFKVSETVQKGAPSEALVDTCWALPWKLVKGKKVVEAGLVAEGYQDPDLRTGLVETSG